MSTMCAIFSRSWVFIRFSTEILEEEGQFNTDNDAVGSNKYKQILGLKEVHLLSLFSLIYVGVEVTMGGTCYNSLQLGMPVE